MAMLEHIGKIASDLISRLEITGQDGNPVRLSLQGEHTTQLTHAVTGTALPAPSSVSKNHACGLRRPWPSQSSKSLLPKANGGHWPAATLRFAKGQTSQQRIRS